MLVLHINTLFFPAQYILFLLILYLFAMASNAITVPILNGGAKPLNRADEVDDVSDYFQQSEAP